ncbi:MAG: hypothetical protein ACREF6_06525 [Alphaproteobacteria bacterium]
MKIKSWIMGVATGAVLLAGLVTGANAAVIDLGERPVPSAINTGNITPTGAFSDDFTFNVSASSGVVASVAINNGQGFAINPASFEVSLFENGSDTGAVADRTGLLFTLSHADLSAAADYILRVSGTAAGFGGNYGVLLNVGEVSQVPLPPAVWLFISALVGLVSLARRRRDRAGPVAA